MEKETAQEKKDNDALHLDEEVREAIRKGETLPEDKYFKKIWEAVESRAPVGEKYYLRSFFAVFFFLAILVLFILFYTDFLSSVLTLKEIRKENAKFFTTSTSTLTSPFDAGKSFNRFEIARGVTLTSVEESKVLLEADNEATITLGFYSGHIILEKSDENRTLLIRLPDLKLTVTQGRCNIFCYDDMIRIIPLTHAVEIETRGKSHQVSPGSVFFLLNRETVVVKDTKGEKIL